MVAKIVDLRGGKKKTRTPSRTVVHAAPARRERRSSPLRTRRRRVRLAAAGAVLLVIAGLVYGVHAISYLPRFTIGTVDVTGMQAIQPTIIQDFVWSELDNGSYHFLSRSNIFIYPRDVIAHDIVASFPRVKSATVALTSPLSRTLTVAIEERQPFARWCEGEGSATSTCYAMDNGGFIFAEMEPLIPADFQSQYIFWGGISEKPIGSTLLAGHMPGVLSLLRVLEQDAHVTPAGVEVESDQDLSVFFAEGFVLKVSFGEDADTVARDLNLILHSDAIASKVDQLEYVDLRFGNRAYYKFKGDSAVNQSQQPQ